MKRFLWFVCFCFFALACRQSKKHPVPSTPNPEKTVAVPQPLAAYGVFIKMANSANVHVISLAAKKFHSLFYGAPTVAADSGFVLFNSLYDKVTDVLNEQHIKDPGNYIAYVSTVDTINSPKSAKTDGRIKDLQANGFKIAFSEGSTYIRQDRTFLANYFYPYISVAMKAYLVELNTENEQGLMEDGRLLISPTQLADRLLWWENFSSNNPFFVFKSQVKETQRTQLTFLLEGTDNTPVTGYSSQTINADYEAAYKHVIRQNPEAQLSAIIKPYYAALKKRNIKAARKILSLYKKQQLIFDYSA